MLSSSWKVEGDEELEWKLADKKSILHDTYHKLIKKTVTTQKPKCGNKLNKMLSYRRETALQGVL